jgi:hypothetical protein
MARFGIDHSCIQVSRHNSADLLVSILDWMLLSRSQAETTSPMVVGSSGLGGGLPETRPAEPQCVSTSSFAWKACHSISGLRPLPPPSSAGPAPCTSRLAVPGGGSQPMCSSCQPGQPTPWPSLSASGSRSLMLMLATIHRQRPSEPRRGMVYDVLLHVVSVEDMRRRGPNGRPLFFPFRFNLGAPDADQDVAPVPAPVRPRHSCSAEYWRPSQRDRSVEDHDGRGGRSLAPQRRSLFQRLRWPGERSCPRERSPRLELGESSRQGGRRHGRDRSLSPAARRSREQSLDHFLHRFSRRELAPDSNPGIGHSAQRGCKPAPPLQRDSPDSGSAGISVTASPSSTTPVVDQSLLCQPQSEDSPNRVDPMIQESTIVVSSVASPTACPRRIAPWSTTRPPCRCWTLPTKAGSLMLLTGLLCLIKRILRTLWNLSCRASPSLRCRRSWQL